MNLIQIGVNVGNDEVTEFIRANPIKHAIFVDLHSAAISRAIKNYEFLNKKESILSYKFVTAFISDEYASPQKVYYGDDTCKVASFSKQHTSQHNQREPLVKYVPVLNINDLLAMMNPIDYLFMDIEGFDCKIIKAIDFQRFKMGKIIFEHFHTDGVSVRGDEYNNLRPFLSSRGYVLSMRNQFDSEATLVRKN